MLVMNIDFRFIHGDSDVEIRIYEDNLLAASTKVRPASDIERWVDRVSLGYYTRLNEDERELGIALFRWLDGDIGDLRSHLGRSPSNGIALVFSLETTLGRLPWELLHDGSDFLANRRPAVVAVRRTSKAAATLAPPTPAQRSLNVLFMASSPTDESKPLDFEAEEAEILQATRRRPIGLFVEESGNIVELQECLNDYDPGFFDVLHISSHATGNAGQAALHMESQFGDAALVTAGDVAEAIQFQSPKVVFISACLTGSGGDDGAAESFAEELARRGAVSVLAWGKRVKDSSAIQASAFFYEALSSGKSAPQALAITHQKLIASKTDDWHHLRFFTSGAIPGQLVQRGHKPMRRSRDTRFVDAAGKLRVASRESFIGRRRQLQTCLRALGAGGDDKTGLLIFGMGGLGKSTIASRLTERLAGFEPIVFWRQFDEVSFLRKLAEFVDDVAVRARVLSDDNAFHDSLRIALRGASAPLLIVIDDFEWNLEILGDEYRPNSSVDYILKSLVSAVEADRAPHRIIITSRYSFASEALRNFHVEPLDSLKGADLEKKIRRLEWFSERGSEDPALQKALSFADGNPRLLEFLDEALSPSSDADALLEEIASDVETWKAKIIWDELYGAVDEDALAFLSGALVLHIPVSRAILDVVARHMPNGSAGMEKCERAGLIEASASGKSGERRFRVSRILPRIFVGLTEPEGEARRSLCVDIAHGLEREWAVAENDSAIEWFEYFRISLEADQSVEAGRRLFDTMLSVQFLEEADRALVFALLRHDRPVDLSPGVLEAALAKKDWRQADTETAWLLYKQAVDVKMIEMGFDSFFREGPEDLIVEIDRLWVEHSDGRFGFSVQKKLFEDRFSGRAWGQFATQVGWASEDQWLEFSEMDRSDNSPVGHFPLLTMCRGTWSRGGSYPISILSVGFTMNLLGYGWRIGGSEAHVFRRSTSNY